MEVSCQCIGHLYSSLPASLTSDNAGRSLEDFEVPGDRREADREGAVSSVTVGAALEPGLAEGSVVLFARSAGPWAFARTRAMIAPSWSAGAHPLTPLVARWTFVVHGLGERAAASKTSKGPPGDLGGQGGQQSDDVGADPSGEVADGAHGVLSRPTAEHLLSRGCHRGPLQPAARPASTPRRA